MAKIMVLGATGSLGKILVRQAIASGHEVSVVARSSSKLAPDIREKVIEYQADIRETKVSHLAALFFNQDVIINTAGNVADGQSFVYLVDRIVTSLESIQSNGWPVCWFMAGAGLLDIDNRGRRGVDMPFIRSTYWPHRLNYERICRTTLDWRILCPGPMVDEPQLGFDRMRTSLNRLPVHVPAFTRFLPGALVVPFFTYRVPEMIVSYADAAALILANVTPGGSMSRRRVGMALPASMRGKKKRWTARSRMLDQK